MSTFLSEKTPDVGTTFRVRREFRSLDSTGSLIDPEEVTLTFEDPQGYRYAVNAERESLGVFYGEIRAQVPGQWRYRWLSDNPRFVYEGSFVVRRSEIEQSNDEVGLPVRFPDVVFFYDDSLSVRFNLYALTSDGLRIGRVDLSLYSFAAIAKGNDRVALADELQPNFDTSELNTGVLSVGWTQDQVERLPDTFWLGIREYQGLDLTDDPYSEGLTWDDFPEITWDQLPDFTWDDFPDHVAPVAIWDRTILVGHFRKNFDGF